MAYRGGRKVVVTRGADHQRSTTTTQPPALTLCKISTQVPLHHNTTHKLSYEYSKAYIMPYEARGQG